MKKLSIYALLAALIISSSGMDAMARAGGGGSFGSRGGRTWSAPPMTRTAPFAARPFDRSYTPRTPPSAARPWGAQRPMGAPGMGFARRNPLMTGFLGGMLGAGLFGMLSGHGFFGGVGGLGSLLGVIIQLFLLFIVVRWAVRLFTRNGAPVQGQYNGVTPPRNEAATGPYGFSSNATPGFGSQNVTINPEDYQTFQRLLVDVQAAWSAQNLQALATMATPEMTSYFNQQLTDYASRGARNVTSNVTFLNGDLAEAWREGRLVYATVAMRYSLIDITTDQMGHVIDGSQTEPQTVTELWSFVRADGRGNWVLSAIQQAGG